MNNSSKMNIKDTCFYMSTRNATKEIKVDANKFSQFPWVWSCAVWTCILRQQQTADGLGTVLTRKRTKRVVLCKILAEMLAWHTIIDDTTACIKQNSAVVTNVVAVPLYVFCQWLHVKAVVIDSDNHLSSCLLSSSHSLGYDMMCEPT